MLICFSQQSPKCLFWPHLQRKSWGSRWQISTVLTRGGPRGSQVPSSLSLLFFSVLQLPRWLVQWGMGERQPEQSHPSSRASMDEREVTRDADWFLSHSSHPAMILEFTWTWAKKTGGWNDCLFSAVVFLRHKLGEDPTWWIVCRTSKERVHTFWSMQKCKDFL